MDVPLWDLHQDRTKLALKTYCLDKIFSIQASQGIKVIDASGKYVMPGGIDPHTHLDAPFMGQITADDFYR